MTTNTEVQQFEDNFEETGDKKQDACTFLLRAAEQFWYACRGAGEQGAVKWLLGDNGALLIYTRGEYRETLMRNIDALPVAQQGGELPQDDLAMWLQQIIDIEGFNYASHEAMVVAMRTFAGNASAALAQRATSVPAQAVRPVVDVDSLAQFIRMVNGNNRLGAGALAEKISEWLAAWPEAFAAPVPTASVPVDLHDAIMNLPCKRADDSFLNEGSRSLYKEGHRDARHAAAELAAAASVPDAGREAAPTEVVSTGQRADKANKQLVVGKFYWIWIALDPDANHEWENDFMPARFAGYADNGDETWNFLDPEPNEWPSRCTYHLDDAPTPPQPGKPSTLAQQIASAQAEVATWPPGMLQRVLPRTRETPP